MNTLTLDILQLDKNTLSLILPHFFTESWAGTLFLGVSKQISSTFVFIAGSSSFESQKMERPSLNVLSPSSPGMLQDAPQLMPGKLSVSERTFVCVGLPVC